MLALPPQLALIYWAGMMLVCLHCVGAPRGIQEGGCDWAEMRLWLGSPFASRWGRKGGALGMGKAACDNFCPYDLIWISFPTSKASLTWIGPFWFIVLRWFASSIHTSAASLSAASAFLRGS